MVGKHDHDSRIFFFFGVNCLSSMTYMLMESIGLLFPITIERQRERLAAKHAANPFPFLYCRTRLALM